MEAQLAYIRPAVERGVEQVARAGAEHGWGTDTPDELACFCSSSSDPTRIPRSVHGGAAAKVTRLPTQLIISLFGSLRPVNNFGDLS